MGLLMAERFLFPERFKVTKKKIIRVLYVYGYGGSYQSSTAQKLKDYLPEDSFKVFCFGYPQRNCRAAVSFLQDKVKKNHIDVLIGSSLGAFVIMCMKVNCKKIMVNPCLIPTVELPKLKPLPGKPVPSPQLIASYAPYEANIFGNLPEGSHCLMAEHDELLGNTYRSQMEAHVPTISIPGGHKLSEEAFPTIQEIMEKMFEGDR